MTQGNLLKKIWEFPNYFKPNEYTCPACGETGYCTGREIGKVFHFGDAYKHHWTVPDDRAEREQELGQCANVGEPPVLFVDNSVLNTRGGHHIERTSRLSFLEDVDLLRSAMDGMESFTTKDVCEHFSLDYSAYATGVGHVLGQMRVRGILTSCDPVKLERKGYCIKAWMFME